MTRAELTKLIEIRDGFKNAYWDFDKWRWAMKWDQFIRDAEHALEQEGLAEALGEESAANERTSEPPSSRIPSMTEEKMREALESIAADDKWDEHNPNALLAVQAMARAALSQEGLVAGADGKGDGK